MAENRLIGSSLSNPTQRRISPRIKLFCMAHFRRSDVAPIGHAWLCAVKDFSRDSIYFVANDHGLSESVLLLLRFPYNLNPSVKGHEYLMEVMRINSLRQGRCGVGARLVPHIPMRVQDGFLKVNTGSSQQSWTEAPSKRIDVYI